MLQLLSGTTRTAAAHSRTPEYALPMTNPYGITLDRAWTEWAAEYGVSPTVAAALFLMSVHRPAHEVAAKLTACEFKQVIDIVRRWPNNFASGTLAALETQKHAAQRELTTSTSTDVASGRPGAGIKASAEDTRRTHECRFESFRIHAPQTAPKPERKLVGREDQREVIGNFKAVQLQPHAAVGEVFYETRTFFARPAQDCCHASKLVAR